MNKYNEESVCPKCGYDCITTHYMVGIHCDNIGGHMRRRCDRCGYFWNELPLDAKDD